MATNFTKELMVKPGKKVRLGKFDPDETLGWDKNHAMKVSLDKAIKTLDHSQYLLYADHKHALLIVFQGRDAAGKDGTIRHVMSGVNPQGCTVTSFKTPSPEEAAHDYLWRVHRAVPEYGNLGIFNRSHYEDVLIVRVHNLVPPEVWGARYDEINAFERELVDNGTTLVKVAMFVSLEEQKKRLAGRLSRPEKYWKYNPGDVDERRLWPSYQQAYQAVLDRTSTDQAPWYVVPCDRKWYCRLAVTELLIEALKDLNLSWPPPNFDVEAEKLRVAQA